MKKKELAKEYEIKLQRFISEIERIQKERDAIENDLAFQIADKKKIRVEYNHEAKEPFIKLSQSGAFSYDQVSLTFTEIRDVLAWLKQLGLEQ